MVEVLVIETANLGDRSYVVHDGASALVVDPQRDIDRVLALLDRHGLRATAVAETHLHNDYLTGGLVLARETGADYLVSADDRVTFDRSAVRDGDVVKVGDLAVHVLHTPGHTPHHLSYAVEAGGSMAGVFTGGSLLFGSTGRPDLVSGDLTESLAHAQWRSARRLARDLPARTPVYPTHGFGSFCSATQSSASESTLARECQVNPALTEEEQAYVESTLAGLDVYPAYYVHMAPGNAAGPPPATLTLPARSDADDLQRRIDAGEWVVDVRSRRDFAAGHAPGMVNIEGSGNVPTYLGWVKPWEAPVTFCGSNDADLAAAVREVARIGISPVSVAAGGPEQWSRRALAAYPVVTFADVAREPDARVLDVRRHSEWQQAHIPGAVHVPIHELPDRLGELPRERLWVHCASGFRASIAASLLDRAGCEVVLIDDDFDAAEAAGVPIRRP